MVCRNSRRHPRLGVQKVTRALLASYFTFAGDVVPLMSDAGSPRDFQGRVEAVSAAGFSGFGLFHTDLFGVVEKYGYAEMRRILADNGIDRLELEALMDWFDYGDRGLRCKASNDLLLEAAGELGAFHVKAGGDLFGDCALEQMANAFGALCDRALVYGTRISVEIIAFSNIATLERACSLLDGAGRSNSGLMLDAWHIVRGNIPFDAIAALPADRILGVELNDGAAQSVGTAFEDTVFRRRFCGEGEFDLTGFIKAVDATGYTGPFGIEVLSDAARSMPLPALSRHAYRTTSDALLRASAEENNRRAT